MTRKLVFLLILLSASAFANQSAQGYCAIGGQVVVTSGLNSATKTLQSYPTCTVSVFIHGGGLATIFSDNSNTPLANPFTATSQGYWQWYAANGRYDVVISGSGITSPFTFSDIVLQDLASPVPAINVKVLNNIRFADQFANLQAAVTDACGSATGAIVYVPAGTYTSAVAITTCTNLHLYCEGNDKSVIAFNPGSALNDALIVNGASNVEIDHCKITGNSNTGRLVSVNSSTNVKVHDNTITGAALIPSSGGLAGVYVNLSSDVWVERNVMANGPAVPNSANNSEIMVMTGGSNRIHIRGNTVTSAGLTTIPIMAFDCVDCDILNNQVSQNNIYSGGGNNGYGITCYASTLPSVLRMRIEGNNITNAAGNGIYVQTCDKAVISGNTIFNVAQQQTDVSIPAAGITIGRCDSCTVTGNTIDTSGKDGIALADVGSHNVFSGNTIRNASQYGINIRSNSSDNIFDHNTIFTTTSEGIAIGASATQTRTAITGNTVNGTSRGGIFLSGACVSCDVSRNIVSNFPTGFFGIASANASTVYTKLDGNIVDNSSNGSTGGGIDVALGAFYTISGNTVRGLLTNGIEADAGVADSAIIGNTVRNVSGTGILTSGAVRSRAIGNTLLSNSTPLNLAASDTNLLNSVDAIAAITGTGLAVAQTSPTLITPNIGVATGTSLNLGATGTLSTTATTGTGSIVLSNAPTLTGTINFSGASGTNLSLSSGFSTPSANITNLSATSTLNVGGGSTMSKYYVVAATITPAATAANTCAEQSFTPAAFNGVVNAGDSIDVVGSATMAANGVFPVLGARAIANGVDITYCNSTAGPLTAPAVTITVRGTR
jgi:parallel beta-helix repeat protein